MVSVFDFVKEYGKPEYENELNLTVFKAGDLLYAYTSKACLAVLDEFGLEEGVYDADVYAKTGKFFKVSGSERMETRNHMLVKAFENFDWINNDKGITHIPYWFAKIPSKLKKDEEMPTVSIKSNHGAISIGKRNEDDSMFDVRLLKIIADKDCLVYRRKQYEYSIFTHIDGHGEVKESGDFMYLLMPLKY